VLLVLAQVGGGMLLLRGWLSRHADMQRMLQVATGAYLGLYVICHLNSTFVYARAAEGIDTNFWFASGGPAGLFGDAWSVRLLPHYAIGVLALVLHVSAGLRVVMLAHAESPARVAWMLPAGWIAGAAVGTAAVLPLLRIHPF
jgi:succinate dehydrogenase hydrophobic anchor subunit